MIQDQPRHQGGQCRLRLSRQSGPHRYAACRWRVPCKQVDLLRYASVCRPSSVPAWHGPLPDSGRQREVIRPKRLRPMLQSLCSEHPVKVPPASPTRPSWCGAPHPAGPWRKSTGQTSMPESLANAPIRMRSGRSAKQHRPGVRSRHECQPEDPTMGARDTEARETRYCGRSYVLLYNETRPHQGRWCFGKTPMQTFLDAMPMAKEKMIAA